jgi:hypothetical protein
MLRQKVDEFGEDAFQEEIKEAVHELLQAEWSALSLDDDCRHGGTPEDAEFDDFECEYNWQRIASKLGACAGSLRPIVQDAETLTYPSPKWLKALDERRRHLVAPSR